MSVLGHLLRRELRDRRSFFVAAALAGLAPAAIAALAARPGEQSELRQVLALSLVVVVLTGMPVSMGVRWLVDGFGAGGRRGFELARPCGAWALGGAKLAAILLMTFGGALLVGLLELVIRRDEVGRGLARMADRTESLAWPLGKAGPPFAIGSAELLCWAVAALPLLLLLALVLTQTSSFAIAGRDRHSLLSLGALLLFAGAVAWSYGRLADHMALGIGFGWLLPLAAALAALGLFAAWRSFAAGSLRDRAHRAYARAFAVGLAALGGLLCAGARVATAPRVEALPGFSLIAPNADGSWLVAGDAGRGFWPAFHLDPARHRAIYLGPAMKMSWTNLQAAEATLVGFGVRWPSQYESFAGFPTQPKQYVRFAPGLPPTRLPEEVDGDDPFFAELDSSGSLLVRRVGHDLSVVRMDDGRELGRVAIPAHGIEGLLFQGRDGFSRSHSASEGFVALVHRRGTEFDLLIDRPEGRKGFVHIERYRFDAAALKLELESSWSLAVEHEWIEAQYWWAGILPLLDAGVPLAALIPIGSPWPLDGGDGAFLARADEDSPQFTQKWILFDRNGNCTGAFELPRDARLVGEIRPGLLAASLRGRWTPFAFHFEPNPGADTFADAVTLLIETRQGRLVRRLPGFFVTYAPPSKARPFLLGPYSEPYDLDSADAEPRRILPWRPRNARGKGE